MIEAEAQTLDNTQYFLQVVEIPRRLNSALPFDAIESVKIHNFSCTKRVLDVT
jgi:hypothetical protein